MVFAGLLFGLLGSPLVVTVPSTDANVAGIIMESNPAIMKTIILNVALAMLTPFSNLWKDQESIYLLPAKISLDD